MNIIDQIKSNLGDDVLSQLSSLVGVGEDKTRSAVGAAIPGVLAVLARLVSGGNAEKVIDALKQIGTDHGGFGDILASGKADELAKKGGSLLEMLLGSSSLPAILAVLGKVCGMASGPLKSLLSYLAPMILATIAKQFSGKTLDPGALSSFFAEQKTHIDAALPPGLSLAGIPGFGAGTSSTAPAVTPTATEGSGLPSWLLPLVGLCLLGLVAWFFFGNPPATDEKPAVESVTPAVKDAPHPASAAPAVTGASIPETARMTADLTGVFSNLTDLLGGVKDVPTAEAAAPRLSGMTPRLDELKGLWDKLPETVKSTVARTAADHLGKLKELVAKVLAIPGVSEKLKPIIDPLLEKLSAFTKS